MDGLATSVAPRSGIQVGTRVRSCTPAEVPGLLKELEAMPVTGTSALAARRALQTLAQRMSPTAAKPLPTEQLPALLVITAKQHVGAANPGATPELLASVSLDGLYAGTVDWRALPHQARSTLLQAGARDCTRPAEIAALGQAIDQVKEIAGTGASDPAAAILAARANGRIEPSLPLPSIAPLFTRRVSVPSTTMAQNAAELWLDVPHVAGRPRFGGAALDRRLGMAATGYSGGGPPEEIAEAFKARFADPTLKALEAQLGYTAGNCAEFKAANELALKGSRIEDIEYAAARTTKGTRLDPPCCMCQFLLAGAHHNDGPGVAAAAAKGTPGR